MQASSELVVCPGCCRELRAAPPPLLTWGAPVALVLLFALVLGTQWQERNPLTWVRDRMDRGLALVETIGESFEPDLIIVMTPIPGGSASGVSLALAAPTADLAVLAEAPAASATLSTVAEEIAALGIGGGRDLELAEAAPEEPPAVEIAAAVVEEAAAPADVPPPTATPLPAVTAVPLVPTPTLEPTPVPPIAEPPTPVPPTPEPPTPLPPTPTATSVAIGIAALTADEPRPEPTATWTPLATVAPVGAVGLAAVLPTPTAENGVAAASAPAVAAAVELAPTATPTPTVTPVAYQVRAGDTLMVIARRYDVSVEALMAANSIGARDVTRIQPGRMLVIPVPTPTPLPTPTPSPIRLDAPVLIGPADGAILSCSGTATLTWDRVQYVKDSDKYVLHMGFVSGVTEAGAEQVTWVVAQARPVTTTEWTLDNTLCNLAPQAYDRQWRWWVEVMAEAEGGMVAVSLPSPQWGFRWE